MISPALARSPLSPAEPRSSALIPAAQTNYQTHWPSGLPFPADHQERQGKGTSLRQPEQAGRVVLEDLGADLGGLGLLRRRGLGPPGGGPRRQDHAGRRLVPRGQAE